MRSFDRTKNLKSLSGLVRPHMKYVPEAPEPIVAPTMTLAETIASCDFKYVSPDINDRNFFGDMLHPVAPVSDMLAMTQKKLGGASMNTVEIERAIGPSRQAVGRCATLSELLAYAKHVWNGKRWVVALGSCYVEHRGGDRGVPCLYVDAGRRELRLLWTDWARRWHAGYSFLVVRK